MGTTNYNDITKWRVLPVDFIAITINTNIYNFSKILDDLSVKIAPILDDNDTGGQTIVGYQILVEFSPVGNLIADYNTLIYELRKYKPSKVYIECNSPLGNFLEIQTHATSITVKDWNGAWETDSGTDTDIRFSLIGIFSVDLDEATSPKLFTN